MGDNGSSYSKIESIWSNAVRLTRSVYPNLQDEIEYIEANLGGGNISCNCSALEFAIENLSTIKLSRDGSQPMEGELVCNNGLKTDIIKARTQSIIDCQNQLRVYQSLGGDGDSGLWLGSDFSFGAPSINLYPYSSSANGKIFIRTPRSNGISGARVEIPGKNDFIDIKIIDSNIIPYEDNYQDLGSSSSRWKNIYAVKGNFSGIVIPDNLINIGPYSTIVYKDDTGVYAKDASGNIIAQGNAGTDDATVLKTALESGGKIIIMPATYTLYFTVTGSTNLIILPDNTTIDGLVSHKTIFEFYIDGSTPGAGQHYNIAEIFTGSCCRIANLTINGKKSYFAPKNYLEYLIYSVNKSSILIENVNLFHSSRCGIVPESENMIIRNVYAEDCLMSMDAISMHQVEVDGYIAKSCENAFYIETGGGTNVFLRNFHFEDCLRGFYTLSNLSNVVIEEGTIKTKNDYSARGIIAQQTSKLFTIKNVKINAPYGYAFFIKGEYLGDIIVSNCYSNSYNGFKAHQCIVDGGYYKANYLFTVSSDHLLIKNANLYTTYRMFYDHVSDIHFENCELNSIASDGTESDITFRRCTIGSKKTDNSGTATISSGNTSVVVSHGLFKAPVRVFLTGTHNEVAKCWVSNISDTEFTINAPSAVTDDRDVYWDAAMS